jgi:voltage-dependent potassium channel beta subunit
MEYRRLGQSGLKLSRLSLGSWLTFGHKIAERDARNMVSCAIHAGVNFFDTAESYADGNAQEQLGRVFRALRVPRDTYCLSSKVFWGGDLPTQRGLSRKHVNDACNASLARLGSEYLDIFFCHRPDPDTPILETAWAMHDLINQGKVMYWGTSEWTASQIRSAFRIVAQHNLHAPVAEQPPYNLLNHNRYRYQTQPSALRFGLGVLATTPLSSGILSGKYLLDDDATYRLNEVDNGWLRDRLCHHLAAEGTIKVEAIQRLAAELGATAAQVSLAWCLLNPTVTSVITGASNIGQLRENLAALEFVRGLDESAIDRLANVAAPKFVMRATDWLRYKSRPGRKAVKVFFGIKH